MWIQVRGDSMRPFLAPGDEVRVEWFEGPTPELAPGEIVIGRSPTDPEWIVHRVIRSSDGSFLTKGDSAFVPDAFSRESVFGRVRELRFHEAPERAFPVHVSLLDRMIAALSPQALPSDQLRSRAIRKLIRALGALRRSLL